MDHRRRPSTPATSPNQSAAYPSLAARSTVSAPAPLISLQLKSGLLAVRDALPDDVDAYISYWHYEGDRVIDMLGIDRTKLGTPDDTRQRFFDMIRTPQALQKDALFTITLDGKVIGYTNINRYGAVDNFAHLHPYRCAPRSALLGLAVLIGPGMDMYFSLFPIRRLILQTHPENQWINHALGLYMPPAETRHLAQPAGLAAAGEYHLRYISRDHIGPMLAESEQLRDRLFGRGARLQRVSERAAPQGVDGAGGEASPDPGAPLVLS